MFIIIVLLISTLSFVATNDCDGGGGGDNGDRSACCSRLHRHKLYCVNNLTESCCAFINGSFVGGQAVACSDDQSGNGVDDTCDVFCGNDVLEPWEGCDDGNTLSGDGCSELCLPEQGVCCKYHIGDCPIVECHEMKVGRTCVPSRFTPRLWIPHEYCEPDPCPSEPPPEAECQCGDDCCPFKPSPDQRLVTLVIVLAILVTCCCCCCCFFGFIWPKREEEEEEE